MAVPMPSWIDVNPRDFAGAAEAGPRLGLEQRGQNIQLTDIATNAALRQAQLQQAGQEASLRAASDARAHEMEGQRLAISAAQAQSELGLKQQELQLQTQKAAQQLQAQQQYQSLVAGGMDPITAALRVGPGLIGESVGGLGTLKRADQAAGFVPRSITLPDSLDAIETSPGHWTVPHPSAEWQGATRTVNGEEIQGQENVNTGEFKPISAGSQGMSDFRKENMLLKLNAQREKLLNDPSNAKFAYVIDTGGEADPDWSKENKAQFEVLKKQVDAIDSQINKYGGGASGGDTSSMTNKTSSGLRYSIVPAQ